jgi:NAD dependent epimerase/dehydratase family enzyme
MLGEFGSVLLNGQHVIPRRLLESGFEFRFPDLKAALADLAEQ